MEIKSIKIIMNQNLAPKSPMLSLKATNILRARIKNPSLMMEVAAVNPPKKRTTTILIKKETLFNKIHQVRI